MKLFALCFNILLSSISLQVAKGLSIPSKVSVSLTKQIPDVPPTRVHEAFLQFTWEKGGGLPLICRANDKTSRTMLLLGEEVLQKPQHGKSDGDTATTIVQDYKLTKLGPIWKPDIEPNTHLGRVLFSPENGGTKMTWDVSFNTLNRQALWQAVTEFSISNELENLVSYVSEPILLTKKISIRPAATALSLTPEGLAEEWLEFVWRNGGGFPMSLPPISLGENAKDRITIPPFVRERIIDMQTTKDSDKTSSITYIVVNPSLFTYPVYDHLGCVKFQYSKDLDDDDGDDDDNKELEMIWQVSVRPIRGCASFIRGFTETVINILARNFKSHIQDENETAVNVYPPRGFMKEKGPLFKVRKETWLGSVLYAHLRDKRSVIDQTKDLLAPWRWGANDEYDGSSVWGVGEISI